MKSPLFSPVGLLSIEIGQKKRDHESKSSLSLLFKNSDCQPLYSDQLSPKGVLVTLSAT